MAIKKSQLYSSIWQGCDELRGGMDASQYKDYVLVLLFVRYVSDKYAGKPDSLVEIPEGGSFADLADLKGKSNIGEGINKVLTKLAEANGLQGVIDAVDFNDEEKLGKGKDMQDRLSNLIAIFENPDLDFSKNKAEGDDKAKRAILACLGSNLTLKGKKVFVNYHSFIKTIIKSRQAVEDELERARTSKISSNKRQNPTNCEVSSLGLRTWDDVRMAIIQQNIS